MKSYFFSFLFAIVASIGTMFADGTKISDLYYNLKEDKTAEVTFELQWDENNYKGLTTANIPASVTYSGITYSVTSIGGSAFFGCSSLTSVTIGNSVTSIGSRAFQGCSSLTSVTIPNSVTNIGKIAFYGCSGLTSVSIPNSVTSIGDWAFDGCSSLPVIDNLRYADTYLVEAVDKTRSSYSIKTGTKWIGYEAFRNCTIMTSVKIPNSVTSIGENAFSDCSRLTSVTIPNSVTSIGSSAFFVCRGLTSVTIPNSVTSIGSRAFQGCSSLTSVTIPNSVTNIGELAFYDCSSMISVTIPNSVTSIGRSAFEKCSSLPVIDNLRYADTYLVEAVDKTRSSYTIKTGTKWIGWGAFQYCRSLTSVTIPNSVTTIGNDAFRECRSLTSVTIPNSVTTIGNDAFRECRSLTSVTIPNSVTSIGEWAFGLVNNVVYFGTATGAPWRAKSVNGYVDGNLVYNDETKTTLLGCFTSASGEIVIPNSVTSIGEYAFWGCSGLTSVTIPNSVTGIGEAAFVDCSSLTSVKIPYSVTSIGRSAFSGCSGLPVIDNLRYADTYLVEAVDKTLSSYTIKKGTKWIGVFAFYDCWNLASVTIPNSVTSIGENAFSDCSRLTSVTIPNSVTSIGESAFYNCSSLPVVDNLRYADTYLVEAVDDTLSSYTIKKGTKWIGSSAFSHCGSLTSITIPNSVTSIGNDAFIGCTGLTSVTIPNSVTSIGIQAFYGCSSLTSVTIPNSVTSIGEEAFDGCSSLTSVTIPNSVTKIGINAFSKETKLIFESKYVANLKSKDKVLGVVDIQFKSAINIIATAQPKYGYSFVKWSDGNEENPRQIILTQDTTIYAEFGISRFGSCGEGEKLKWKYDKDTRTLSISGNGQLTENIHFGIEAMKEMETLVIQDGIMSIGDNAFYEAGMLHTVYVPKEAPHLGQNVFPKSASIYMPCDAKTRGYKNPRHGWSSYDVRYEPLTYKVIGKSSDTNAGYVKTPEHICDPLQVTAKSYEGYHFVKWSDGETRNPRQMTSLKCDTTFMAEFEISRSGECGYRNQLHWEYDKETKTLTISGQGALTENMFFGLEALQEMEQLIIGDGVSVIGLAFRGCSTLKSITNHSLVPQQMLDGAFDSSVYSSAILYLPKKAKGDYKKTDGWKNFKKVKTIKE